MRVRMGLVTVEVSVRSSDSAQALHDKRSTSLPTHPFAGQHKT